MTSRYTYELCSGIKNTVYIVNRWHTEVRRDRRLGTLAFSLAARLGVHPHVFALVWWVVVGFFLHRHVCVTEDLQRDGTKRGFATRDGRIF